MKNVLVQMSIRQQLLQPGVLLLQFLQPLSLLRFHPAILVPPAVIRRLTDTQSLQHLPESLPCVEQTVCFLQLLDDLLWTVTLTLLA